MIDKLELELEELGKQVSNEVFNELKNDELLRRTEKPRITKEEINKVTDPNKRVKLIRENMDLYE